LDFDSTSLSTIDALSQGLGQCRKLRKLYMNLVKCPITSWDSLNLRLQHCLDLTVRT